MKWFNENVCDVRNYIVIHKNQSHKLYGLGQKQMRNVSRYMFCNHRCCTNIIENKKISPMSSFYYDFYFLLHFHFFFRFCCCWFSATHVNINRKLFGTSRSQQIENVDLEKWFFEIAHFYHSVRCVTRWCTLYSTDKMQIDAHFKSVHTSYPESRQMNEVTLQLPNCCNQFYFIA